MARIQKSKLPEIHIDIDSHNENPARRKGTAKPRRVSQITKKAPSKRLVKRRLNNTEKGYFPNPVTDAHKAALENEIALAVRAVQTPTHMRSKAEDVQVLQARLSYAQGLITAAKIVGLFTAAEIKFFMMQLKTDQVIGR